MKTLSVVLLAAGLASAALCPIKLVAPNVVMRVCGDRPGEAKFYKLTEFTKAEWSAMQEADTTIVDTTRRSK